MVVMQLSSQGFAEHYENMTEDELEGEGHRTRLENHGVCFPPFAHKAHRLPVASRNPFRHPDMYPVPFGTLSVSEYYRPIYQSLPMDHSGAPRHVRDLIRDPEQHSVINSHNSYNTISSTNVKRADPTGSRTM